MNKSFSFVLVFLALVGHAHAADSVRVFYFGNGLTGCTNPAWHQDLGNSAAKEWQDWAWLGAGWQLWQHREELAAGKDLFGAGSKGDLTLDENLIKSAPHHGRKFYGEKWDAVEGHVNRTQDFSYHVFRGLQERFPELWTTELQ